MLVYQSKIIFRYNNGYSFKIIPVKYKNFNPANPLDLSVFHAQNLFRKGTLIDDIPTPTISLWLSIKSIELALLEEFNEKPVQFILILDQFEEIFTHSPEVVNEIGLQLSELYLQIVPNDFKKALNREMLINKKLSEHKYFQYLENPIKIKIILAIRSDKFSLLDRITKYIPDLLTNCYELRSLSRQDAVESIVKPAQIESAQFKCKPFIYTERAIEEIISFLTTSSLHSNDTNVPIETFQIQVICEYCEKLVIEKQLDKISKSCLTDLKSIFSDYYDSKIKELPKADQTKARIFIEEGLLYDAHRISLDGFVISRKYNIDKQLLNRLVDTFLLREEPNTVEGMSYEISHDTLVEPIKKAYEKRQKFTKKHQMKIRITVLSSLGLFIIIGLTSIILFLQDKIRTIEVEKRKVEAANEKVMYERSRADIMRNKAENYTNRYEELLKLILDEQNVKAYSKNYYAIFKELGEIQFERRNYEKALMDFNVAKQNSAGGTFHEVIDSLIKKTKIVIAEKTPINTEFKQSLESAVYAMNYPDYMVEAQTILNYLLTMEIDNNQTEQVNKYLRKVNLELVRLFYDYKYNGEKQFKAGNKAKAKEFFEKAKYIRPDDESINNYLINCNR